MKKKGYQKRRSSWETIILNVIKLIITMEDSLGIFMYIYFHTSKDQQMLLFRVSHQKIIFVLKKYIRRLEPDTSPLTQVKQWPESNGRFFLNKDCRIQTQMWPKNLYWFCAIKTWSNSHWCQWRHFHCCHWEWELALYLNASYWKSHPNTKTLPFVFFSPSHEFVLFILLLVSKIRDLHSWRSTVQMHIHLYESHSMSV